MLVLVILAILLIIYLLTLSKAPGTKLNIATTKSIRAVLYILAPMLVTLLIMRQYNIYPRGYWVTKLLFWTVFFLAMILSGLGEKSVGTSIERFIYKIFFILPLAFIPLLLIPFFGAATGLLFYVSFIGDKSFILYADDKIRVERQGIRFLGPDPPLEIYVKEGLFCHRDTVLPMSYDESRDRLKVDRANDSTYFLIHYSPDNWQVPAGFEEFNYTLRAK